ncbi:phage holin family protein [Thermaurantiacus sp.]
MAARPETGPGVGPAPETLAATARRVVADASTLIRTEATLARLETGANVREASGVAARALLGLFLSGLGLLFLLLGGLVALAGVIGWLAALLGTAAALGVAGGLLLVAARRGAGQLSLLPERALGRIAADLRTLSARLHPGDSGARSGDRG